MRAQLPGTDILANPHINSKIHVWKKDYGSLFDVLSKSGIGWNCSTHTLDILDEGVWEAQKKADPHIKGMRFKSWLYYLQWQEIFGKDRATGENAIDYMDFVNDFFMKSETGELFSVPKSSKAEATTPEHVEENTPTSKAVESVDKKGKRIKRKAPETEMTALVSTLGEFMKSSDETFGNIAMRMGNKHEAKVSRTTLNESMKEIPGLSLQDKIKVSDELIQNNNRLEYLLSLPSVEQAEYVFMLLDGRLK
ncbi:hypothetical protein ACS0TY_020192 [Phlomoides rotata]